MTASVDTNFAMLDDIIESTWNEILTTSELVTAIKAGRISKELYVMYMIETYHYTSHNARNQALAGVTHAAGNPVYGKFCFHHAAGETGHEKMALHDLLSTGMDQSSFAIPEPLPATETLIGYLYWISMQGNPYRRLGYSYWAESSYQYINPLVRGVKDSLGLADSQLTFFVAHSEIDDDHAKEVRLMLERTCKNDADWRAVAEAAQTSLRLTGRMIEAVFDEYQHLMNDKSWRYAALRPATCVSA
jgi:pyrroloquinoline quinone (PQQ) biosynthesis protein C